MSVTLGHGLGGSDWGQSRWRNRVAAGDFGAALLEAYTAAKWRAGEALALATFAAEEAGVDPPDPWAADRARTQQS